MKKLFLIALAAITVAGLALSCQKTAGTNQNTEGESSIDATITIDGVFDDWKYLVDKNAVSIAEVPEDEDQYPYLLKMMSFADKTNLFFYFEYQAAEDQTQAPITIEIDTDDDETTGFTDWLWKDAGWDYALESSAGFLGAGAYKKINDFKLIRPNDGVEGVARSWSPNNWNDSASIKGVANKGVLDKDVYVFEIKLPRSNIKATKKGIARVSCYVENVLESWVTVGMLPNDGGAPGQTEMMEVSLP